MKKKKSNFSALAIDPKNVYYGKFISLLFQNKNFIMTYQVNQPVYLCGIKAKRKKLMPMRSIFERPSSSTKMKICVTGPSRGHSLEQLEGRKSPSVLSSQWT